MVTFNNEHLLNEGLTDVVYHFTSLKNLENILKTNRFYASVSLAGSEANLSRNNLFYFSTTRNKTRRIHISRTVRIKLDGRKLSQKYKAFPVDYHWETANEPDNPDYKPKNAKNPNFNISEFEDRIVLNKPYIEDANKYIINIDILSEDTSEIIIYECGKHNIPVSFYKNSKDFIAGQNAYAVFNDRKRHPHFYREHIIFMALISFNLNEQDTKKYFKLDDFDASRVQETKEDIKLYNAERFNRLIQNLPATEEKIYVLDMLVKDMKKMKTKTLSEYIKAKFHM